MDDSLLLRKAGTRDLSSVLALYKAAVGAPGCTWNEYYPSEENISEDYAADCLYVLEKDGDVIGAASVVPENELDGITLWKNKDGAHREIARVCVSEKFRGQGYAKLMLTSILSGLASQGCRSVRLLAATGNEAAARLYKSLGFSFLGTTHVYGNDYFICEKTL